MTTPATASFFDRRTPTTNWSPTPTTAAALAPTADYTTYDTEEQLYPTADTTVIDAVMGGSASEPQPMWFMPFSDNDTETNNNVVESSSDSTWLWWWIISIKIAIGILLCLCIIIAVVGNLLIVLAVSTNRRLKRLGNVFIASLAIADLLVGIFVMPLALLNDLLGYWPLPIVLCELWCSFDILGSTASILNLCAISLDRYICIRNSLDYAARVTVRKVIVAVVIVWTLSALISFLPFQLGLQNWTPGHTGVTGTGVAGVDGVDTTNSSRQVTSMLNRLANRNNEFLPFNQHHVLPPLPITTHQTPTSSASGVLPALSNRYLFSHRSNGTAWPYPVNIDEYDDNIDVVDYPDTKLSSTPTSVGASSTTPTSINSMLLLAKLHRQQASIDYQQPPIQQINIPTTASTEQERRRQKRWNSRYAVNCAIPIFFRLATDATVGVGDDIVDDDENDHFVAAQSSSSSVAVVADPELQQQCFLDISFAYAITSSTISFYIPCCVMLIIYHRLFREARKHVRAIRKYERVAYSFMSTSADGASNNSTTNSSIHTTNSAQATAEKTTSMMTSSVSEHKAAVTLGVIMGTFLLCWLPFFVINPIAAACSGQCISHVTFKALTWLGYCNSSLNPIIYSIFNQDFRFAFAKLLHLPGYSTIIAEAEKPEWLRRVPGSLPLRSSALIAASTNAPAPSADKDGLALKPLSTDTSNCISAVVVHEQQQQQQQQRGLSLASSTTTTNSSVRTGSSTLSGIGLSGAKRHSSNATANHHHHNFDSNHVETKPYEEDEDEQTPKKRLSITNSQEENPPTKQFPAIAYRHLMWDKIEENGPGPPPAPPPATTSQETPPARKRSSRRKKSSEKRKSSTLQQNSVRFNDDVAAPAAHSELQPSTMSPTKILRLNQSPLRRTRSAHEPHSTKIVSAEGIGVTEAAKTAGDGRRTKDGLCVRYSVTPV